MLGIQDGEEKKGEWPRCGLVAVGWQTDTQTDQWPRKEAGVGRRAGGGSGCFCTLRGQVRHDFCPVYFRAGKRLHLPPSSGRLVAAAGQDSSRGKEMEATCWLKGEILSLMNTSSMRAGEGRELTSAIPILGSTY